MPEEWTAGKLQEITVFTYYSGQRKVFQAVVSENEVCFIEVPVRPVVEEMATRDQCGELWVDIHARADTETIRAIIQALKSC